MTHPCLACGACCASFRVDFSVHETQDMGGDVPDGLAVEVTSSTCRMRGTDHSPPRCAALTRWAHRRPAASTNGAPRPAANLPRAARPANAPGCGTACRPTLRVFLYKTGLYRLMEKRWQLYI